MGAIAAMSDFRVCIERMQNGYEVSLSDPKIVKANNTRDKNGYTPYRDPTVEYAFKDVDEVLAFLKENLDKALPANDFSSAFDAAAKAAQDNEDANADKD